MLETELGQVDTLSIAVAEMGRLAQIEGVETLLIVATQHRSDHPVHRFVSVGYFNGCERCAMESLGGLLATGMPESMIARLLDELQSARADHSGQVTRAETGSQVEGLASPNRQIAGSIVLEFARG